MLEKGVEWMRSTKQGRTALDEEFGWTAIPRVAGQSARARRAAATRLDLLQASDFSRHLREFRFPVRYLGGSNDTAVDVLAETRLLRNRLHADCGFQSRLVVGAPHSVFASNPREASERVADWVDQIEASEPAEQ